MEQNLGPEALVQWLQLMISSPDPENEHHEMRLESDENALQIMTVHKSKGLEFPIVFCPNLQDWTPKRQSSTGFVHLPEKNQQSRVLHLDLNSDQQAAKAHQDEWLSESLRLTYVALTRARNRCYFCSLENEKNPKENPVSRLLQQKPLDQMPSVVTKNFPTNSPSPFSLYQSAPRLRLNVQRRRRTVPDRPRMASFSSLTRNRNPESFDRDYCDRQPWQAMPPESTEPDIFTFPRGTEGGIILHHILEHIDFNASQENWTTVVQENLQRHDLGPEWIPVILDMIVRLSGMDLGLGFTLAQVKRSCPEMQFMLPLQRLSPAKLQDIYAGSGIDTADVLAARLKTVSFQEVEGVLSGFADLVFIHENKWFVLDWKSNYLGPSLDDYRPSALWDSIVHSLYFLQYHFYALAVHRYAASRVLSYNFEKNFGGVFYVYLRGLNTDSDAAHGVHFACPPAGFMAHLEKNLCFNQTVFPERKNVQHH
jgi:exodeoxyribonuclease V beta subunit